MFSKWSMVVAVTIVCITMPMVQPEARSADSIAPSLKDFDKAVREARVEMRQYRALVQGMMKAAELDKTSQTKALHHLQNCRGQWATVVECYSANPPAEYSADVRFGARLSEISDAMQEMEQHLRKGLPAKSFQSCSSACGLFVAMHEENNLVYALDRIFHMRKLAKTVTAAGSVGGPEAIREIVPEIMHQRNRILVAPCPWQDQDELCAKYKASLQLLSSTIDDLAISASNDRQSESLELLRQLVDIVDRAYGDAL